MNLTNFPWLTAIILFPIVAALLVPIIPDKDGKTVRWFALTVGLIDFALIIYAFYSSYDFANPNLQLVESYQWLPEIDLRWSLGADGLSMPLIILTGFITTLAILAAWLNRLPNPLSRLYFTFIQPTLPKSLLKVEIKGCFKLILYCDR